MMIDLLEHGVFSPHAAVLAAQFPGFWVAPVVVVVVDVLSVEEVVVVVVEVLVLVVGVGGLIPSQSLVIRTSAQFQNCSAAFVTSTGCAQVFLSPG
jgi:hypothetical protein